MATVRENALQDSQLSLAMTIAGEAKDRGNAKLSLIESQSHQSPKPE